MLSKRNKIINNTFVKLQSPSKKIEKEKKNSSIHLAKNCHRNITLKLIRNFSKNLTKIETILQDNELNKADFFEYFKKNKNLFSNLD